MPVDGTIELVSNEQQPSSDSTQNNNGNDRSLTSTGVGAPEKSTPIIDLLENKVAKMLGALVCGWVLVVLVEGGMVGSLETKDCGFITLLFFLVFFRCWRYYCPEAYWSLTEATQSLSADYMSIPNNIQQLAVPICYIHIFFYWCKLLSAIISVVLSVMRLASQDFGKKEVENKESRDFTLKFFYGLALAEALVLLFALTLSFPIMGNSVGLADGPADDPENGPGDGPKDSPGDGPGDGPEDGPGYGSGDGSGDGPVNQSNEFNAVAQMDRPANQSNDFNSEGPADSLPNLRQRRREIPQVLGWSVGVNRRELLEQIVGRKSNILNLLEQEDLLDDGHSWRKYGQKDILGAKHPRGYYCCTYRNSQGCQATKQVQRTDNNPTVFDVIYQGIHTCIDKSNTRPGSNISCITNNNNNNNNNRKTLPKCRCQVKVGSTGGVEGSLDDGHSWRKYGQKDILGAKHPRGYYRCTHRHSQGCQATKQVQRTDDNPTVFDVIYQGIHTCIDSDLTEVVSALSATTSTTNSPLDDVDPFLTD